MKRVIFGLGAIGVLVALSWLVWVQCDNGEVPEPSEPKLCIGTEVLDFKEDKVFDQAVLENCGTGKLTWNAWVSNDWITIKPNRGQLTAGATDMMAVTVIRNSWMQPGDYEGAIWIKSNGGNDTVLVKMKVKETTEPEVPKMYVTPTALDFQYEIDGFKPAAQWLKISSSNDSNFTWKACVWEIAASWLSIVPAAGEAGDSIKVMVNVENLLPKNYSGFVSITAEGVQNPSVSISVTLTVKESVNLWSVRFEAEKEVHKNHKGWFSVVFNDSVTYILARIESYENCPDDEFGIKFEFEKPDGVDTVSVVARVDVDDNDSHDSFWVKVNNELCEWSHLSDILGDGWSECQVYDFWKDKTRDRQFVLKEGLNKILVFPRAKNAKMDWIEVQEK